MRNKPLLSIILGVMFMTTAAMIAPPRAYATTFAPMTTEQFTDASTYIVRGEVLEVWSEMDEHENIWTQARVKVETTLKGPDSPEELVVHSLGGVVGTSMLTVPGQAMFSLGEKVLLFLAQQNSGRLVPVSKFLGKYMIRRAPSERRSYVMTWHAREKLTHYDGRFLPHPVAGERLYLDDMLERINTRLDTGWDGKEIPGISLERLQTINTPERRMRR